MTEDKDLGMASNVMALLCYVLCPPAGGILFLLLEKEDAHVRFHAWQSIFFTAVFVILMMAIRLMEMLFGLLAGLLGSAIGDLDWLLFLASGSVLVICLVKAYQGEKWEIPVIGKLAAKKTGGSYE